MKIQVLDHGYVEFVEAWGTGKEGTDLHVERDPGGPYAVADFDYEVGIIEAARQSTQGNFRGWDQDAKLLKHLYTNKHMTPFEFSGMVIEVQMPILVTREWHRHRTQSYNEMSARYEKLPDLCYVPTAERALQVNQAGRNKQAAGTSTKELTADNAILGIEMIEQHCRSARERYEFLLDIGWPKELARGVLPFFQYTRMRASANLRNWLAFLTLRTDPNAQWEIQQFAWAVSEIIGQKFPQTDKLWAAAEWT